MNSYVSGGERPVSFYWSETLFVNFFVYSEIWNIFTSPTHFLQVMI